MNISELARHLDVAVSTVSRVLSGDAGKYRISEKTVLRVQEAAEKFQVTPDPLGAGLRRGKLGMVGLLVPDITNPFFSALARAIELRFRASGMAVQLCDSAEDSETETLLLKKLLLRRLDGLIVAPVGHVSDQLETAIDNSPMPIVVLDRLLPGLDAPSVSINNFEAGKLAAGHLISSGHSHLGCLRGDDSVTSDQERLAGVKAAMNEAGLDPASLAVTGNGYTRESSLPAATELLSLNPRPTGILSLSGQGILSILEASRILDLSIPKDFSVIAFDEQPWSALMQPPISTIAQPIEAMAEKAASLLNLDGKLTEVTSAIFEATLCARESVGPPPKA